MDLSAKASLAAVLYPGARVYAPQPFELLQAGGQFYNSTTEDIPFGCPVTLDLSPAVINSGGGTPLKLPATPGTQVIGITPIPTSPMGTKTFVDFTATNSDSKDLSKFVYKSGVPMVLLRRGGIWVPSMDSTPKSGIMPLFYHIDAVGKPRGIFGTALIITESDGLLSSCYLETAVEAFGTYKGVAIYLHALMLTPGSPDFR